MELNINITTGDHCKVIIQDKSKYLSETSTGISKGEFKFSETVSIDVLQHNKPNELIYGDPVYTLHNSSNPILIPIKFDGWFTVVHIVLPSKKWILDKLDKNKEYVLKSYDTVYFSDGVNIYKYINGNISLVTIQEVLNRNLFNTTISKTLENFVSICFLRKCYINLCLRIFNDRGFSSCYNKNTIDSELVYKRDLVWMAINVIKYLTQCNQLAEVERIIETIHRCNGLCPSTNIINEANGCGCH